MPVKQWILQVKYKQNLRVCLKPIGYISPQFVIFFDVEN